LAVICSHQLNDGLSNHHFHLEYFNTRISDDDDILFMLKAWKYYTT